MFDAVPSPSPPPCAGSGRNGLITKDEATSTSCAADSSLRDSREVRESQISYATEPIQELRGP